jgi:enoyl-CoA hydratase/carnithine racemase
MTEEKPILLTSQDGVATLRLNRPERRNAIDDATRALMIEMLEAAAADPAVRALVVTGTGSAFCAGGDVRGMSQRLSAPAEDVAFNGWRRQGRTHRAVALLHNFPKPTIAAVNGAAAGLGCDVALCCDFIMAAESAHFTMSFIARGLIPDGGGMYFLPRRVGLARAKELVFSGRRVGAAEALAMQMIERVVPDAELLPAAEAWARELSAGSPAALALAKSVMDRSLEMSFEDVLAEGAKAQALCYTTAEHRASVAAFLAKSSAAKSSGAKSAGAKSPDAKSRP